jgi:hypothetical protein
VPLKHSASQAAFHRNVAELRAAGHPVKQALAIAYDVQRKAGHGHRKQQAKKEGK